MVIPQLTVYSQVLSYDDDQQLQRYIDQNCDFRFDCGHTSTTTSIKVSTKTSFVQLMAKHHVFYRCKAEIDQFIEGLYQ